MASKTKHRQTTHNRLIAVSHPLRAAVLRIASSTLGEGRFVDDAMRLERLGDAVGGNRPMAELPLVVVSFGGEQEGAVGGFISERGLARRSEMSDRGALAHALGDSSVQRLSENLGMELELVVGHADQVDDGLDATRCLAH